MSASLRVIGTTCFIVMMLLINRMFGEIEGTRFLGFSMLIVSIFFAFKNEIELVFGGKKTGIVFTGLNKTLVIIPLFVVSLLIIFYPKEILPFLQRPGSK
ncbi:MULTISPECIES: hypothetical protein [Vibrio]|uniref:hypothetical protein n=1 Tax=Vibrio TaxID=662 RepID=UPI000C83B9C4|nr:MULTISPECIES: hypothetical protein [Vibrio]PMO38272.1 hypothetical protein BCT11_17530 [Vibrio sp. 10N.222.52.B12]